MRTCEFCRMRGHSRPAQYTVRVDGIDWELCYDDMWNEVYYMNRGKVVDSRKAEHQNVSSHPTRTPAET